MVPVQEDEEIAEQFIKKPNDLSRFGLWKRHKRLLRSQSQDPLKGAARLLLVVNTE